MKRLLILIFLLLSCSSKDMLPDISVKNLKGEEVKLSSYKGQKTLIYVWSRTCAGHTKDLKKLSMLVNQYPYYRIISYAVAMDVKDVEQSYQQIGINPNFVTLVDPSVKFNDYFPITFLPSTYLFDSKGKLVASYAGLPDHL
jgi:peroxiredoxin